METESDFDKIKTKYLYSRRTLFEMFKQPVDTKNEKLFSVE